MWLDAKNTFIRTCVQVCIQTVCNLCVYARKCVCPALTTEMLNIGIYIYVHIISGQLKPCCSSFGGFENCWHLRRPNLYICEHIKDLHILFGDFSALKYAENPKSLFLASHDQCVSRLENQNRFIQFPVFFMLQHICVNKPNLTSLMRFSAPVTVPAEAINVQITIHHLPVTFLITK